MEEIKKVDWAKIQNDYRANIKSNRTLAEEHGISETAIRKRAKKENWERDLTEKIEFKFKALVRSESAKEVRSEVRTSEEILTEKEIVEANAQLQANIILNHRSVLRKKRSLHDKLEAELEAITDNQELFERLGELLIDTTPNENGKVDQAQVKRMEALKRALDLASRVDTFKKLVETARIIIDLERQAFGIKDDEEPGKQTVADFLDSLQAVESVPFAQIEQK